MAFDAGGIGEHTDRKAEAVGPAPVKPIHTPIRFAGSAGYCALHAEIRFKELGKFFVNYFDVENIPFTADTIYPFQAVLPRDLAGK